MPLTQSMAALLAGQAGLREGRTWAGHAQNFQCSRDAGRHPRPGVVGTPHVSHELRAAPEEHPLSGMRRLESRGHS
jgi:hypothetical protein